MGGKIVWHSFRLLFINLSNAMKISFGPYALGIALCAAILVALGVPLRAVTSGQVNPQVAGGAAFLAVILCLVIILFVSSWVAVAWHRYVLLEEYPTGFLPALSGRPVWPYLGRAVLLTLVIVLLAIPLGMVVGLVAFGMAGEEPSLALVLLVGVIMGAILTWVWMRLGLVLPAAAVDRPFGMGESWSRTAPLSGAIFVAVLIVMALNAAVDYLFGSLLGEGVVTQLLSLFVNWVSLMVGISILTTLYGVVVEGRSID